MMEYKIFFSLDNLTMFLTAIGDNLDLEWTTNPDIAMTFDAEWKAEEACRLINDHGLFPIHVTNTYFA